MKKFAFLLISLALLSCSKSDEPISNSTKKFTPPSWLQGTWVRYYKNTNDIEDSYKIISDNLFYYTGSPNNPSSIIDYNEGFGKIVNTTGYSYDFTEESNTTKYVITKTQVSGGVTLILKEYFIKKSNNSFIFNDDGDPTYGFIYVKL